VDVVSYDWMSRNSKEAVPEPNFNVVKKCRNFEAVVAWARENEVPDAQEKRKLLRAPPNARVKQWEVV
jgi:hypothetical protein